MLRGDVDWLVLSVLVLSVLVLSGLVLSVPVDLTREEARMAARHELAQQIYRHAEPGLVEQGLRWLLRKLWELLEGAADISPGGYVSLVGVVALIVLGVVALRLKLGPLARSAATGDPLFVGGPRSSSDYRSAADAHAAVGEWAAAVRERLRAIIRSLEERDLLEPRPGRTADEAALEAGAVLPTCAEALRGAAREFDDIWYGGRPARRESDQRLREVDTQVRNTRPTLTAAAR